MCIKMLSVSSCSSRARSRFRAIRGLWALYCGAPLADREVVGGAAEGRMEEGRTSGEETEADTSPPDSPSEAEEESGKVELARTPREPRVAKGKPPGGFHRVGQRAWQGFRQKRKIPQTPAQAVPLLPKTPGEEYGTPRVAELNAWDVEEALVGGEGGALGATGKVVERRVSLGGGEKEAAAPVSSATLPRPSRRGGKRRRGTPVPRTGLRSEKTRGMPDHNPAGASQGTAPWQ